MSDDAESRCADKVCCPALDTATETLYFVPCEWARPLRSDFEVVAKISWDVFAVFGLLVFLGLIFNKVRDSL